MNRELATPESAVPTPADVLTWIAAASPAGWFPTAHVALGKNRREQLQEPIVDLLRLGFIEVVDWVRGQGQGFAITDLGKQKLGGPIAVPPPKNSIPVVGLTTFERGERARDAFANPQPSVVARALTYVCLIWFVVGLGMAISHGKMMAYLGMSDTDTLLKIGAAFGPRLYAGEWWRLAVCCFCHVGIVHLLLNSYGLFLAGSTAENLWGKRKFAIIFIVSAIAGSAFATAMKPNAVLAGASGGIWGILFSIIAWLMLNRQHLPPEWVRDSFKQLGWCVFINAIASGIPGISWQAHFAGGVAGFVTACSLYAIGQGSGARGRIAIGTLILAIITGVFAYRYYVRNSETWEPIRLADRARRDRPFYEELNRLKNAANVATAKVPLERVLKLHADGSVAMANGNPKRLQTIANAAKELKSDADAALVALGDIDRFVQENRDGKNSVPVTGFELLSSEVAIFQHISAFVNRIDQFTSSQPPQLKAWLELDAERKLIKSSFTSLQAERPNSQAP